MGPPADSSRRQVVTLRERKRNKSLRANDQIDTTHPGYLPGQRLAAETVKTEEDPNFYIKAQQQLRNRQRATPENLEKAAPGESVPVQGLHSRLFQWVQGKGPASATAERWAGMIKRGDFTREEVSDMKLDQFLENAGPRGADHEG